MVTPPLLNSIYRYAFYYIDYQAYVFRGLVVNEFGYRVYACGDGCQCMYNTLLQNRCMIDGAGVLEIMGSMRQFIISNKTLFINYNI